jgi:hypothetical protein
MYVQTNKEDCRIYSRYGLYLHDNSKTRFIREVLVEIG